MGEKSEGRRRREEFGFEGLEGITPIFPSFHSLIFSSFVELSALIDNIN
jgi:hypothetical protein